MALMGRYELRVHDPAGAVVERTSCNTLGELGLAIVTVGERIESGSIDPRLLDVFNEATVTLHAVRVDGTDRGLTEAEHDEVFAAAQQLGASRIQPPRGS
jgi:hypothetical protein